MFGKYSQDAYQIAENTVKHRHSDGCNAPGVGALATELPPERLCTCWAVSQAQSLVNRWES